MPNDPKYAPGALYGGMWHLPQIWAPTAWAARTGTKATKVCVIDTGARRTHQDLAANIVGGWNRWAGGRGGGAAWRWHVPALWPGRAAPRALHAEPPPPSRAAACRAVYNTSTNPAQPLPGTDLYNDFSDWEGHGTHTAGSVGAAGNNGLGVTGVAWNVSLYICRAATLNEGFYTSALLDCYYLCRQVGGEAQAGLD